MIYLLFLIIAILFIINYIINADENSLILFVFDICLLVLKVIYDLF